MVALPAGGAARSSGLLFCLVGLGMGPCGLSTQTKGHAQWNWSRNSVLPFPSMFGQSWDCSGWECLRESADLWKLFSGTRCLGLELWRSVVICWGKKGGESADLAFCCCQGSAMNSMRMVFQSLSLQVLQEWSV